MKDEEGIAIDYRKRLGKVFQYIDQNLASKLTLEKIAEIANFSPHHFHRIFKGITQETLNEYVTRRRLEKSALDLLHTNKPLGEIHVKYGFNSSASFSRTFKKFFQASPTDFRKKYAGKLSRISQQESKNGQVEEDYEKYLRHIEELSSWIAMNGKVDVKECPELTIASVTHIGVGGIENAFERLIKWATSKHLFANAKIGRLFYDSFKVTAPEKVRMGVFITTLENFEAEGEIQKVIIKKGKCIVGRFEIAPNDFEKTWSGLFIRMNEKGYIKRDENPFEIYHNDFREHPDNKFIVDFYIPIE